MVVFPNSKINIGLRIVNKRDDGYHNLESVFYPIGLCDILEIVKADKFSFEQSGLPISGGFENNLVVKAYELFKQKYSIGPVSIHLHKVIPTGAGLGGGSSDATFTLKLLNELFNLNLTDNELKKDAEMLGSDCPFFIYNRPCLVTGRGENIEQIDFNLTKYWIKLIHPGIEISTKEAFSGIHYKSDLTNLKSIIKSEVDLTNNRFINDFESSIFKSYAILTDLKNGLLKEGAIYASMSGSGSSIYGIFEKEPMKSGGKNFEYIDRLKF